MKTNSVTSIYFSPAGTTKAIVNEIAKQFSPQVDEWDLLKSPIQKERIVSSDSLVIVGMPVYAGRIPAVCADMLSKFKGNHTPTILVAVYGNRDYDDALIEMKDIMEKEDFAIIGAGAFIAEHSVMPIVATTRPDNDDRIKIAHFALQCAKFLEDLQTLDNLSIKVKGNTPYRVAQRIPLKPSADKKCNLCGACSKICPTHAIPKEHPNKTNETLCISCTACIHACPQEARAFRGLLYKIAEKEFAKKNALRKEPEVFFANLSRG